MRNEGGLQTNQRRWKYLRWTLVALQGQSLLSAYGHCQWHSISTRNVWGHGHACIDRVYFILYLRLYNCNSTFLTAYLVYYVCCWYSDPGSERHRRQNRKEKKKKVERTALSRLLGLLAVVSGLSGQKTDGKGPSVPVADLVSQETW